jgi:hypothetical protein
MPVSVKFPVLLLISILFLCAVSSASSAFTINYLNTTDSSFWPLVSLNATKGEVLAFNATVSDPSTSFSFGDGFGEDGQNVAHAYTFGTNGYSLMLQNGSIVIQVKLTNSTGIFTDTFTLRSAMDPIIFAPVSATIAPLNQSYANAFIMAIGGNGSAPNGWIGIDFIGGMTAVQNVYVSVVGMTIFMIIIFAIPFIMTWIVMKDFVVSGILGGILGVWIINRLPGNMKLLAVTFIALSIVAIIYSLLKERM